MTHWEVSTLPATTAAGYTGFKRLPAGMMILSGFRHPPLSGMSRSTRLRNTYNTAAWATAAGALKLSGDWSEVPVKSTTALRALRSMATRTWMWLPSSSW